MTMIEKLLENHPVRKTKKQKEAFRSWFIGEAEGMGYTAKAEQAKGYGDTMRRHAENMSRRLLEGFTKEETDQLRQYIERMQKNLIN